MDSVGGHAEPGNSALGQAVLFGREADAVERQIAELTTMLHTLRRQQQNWAAGGRAELGVVRVLIGMDDAGWHVLADRHWPGTRRANIDVLLVGPGGVFVVDVKNWREVRLEGGRLWRGDADADDEVRKLLDQTDAVEQLLAAEGLPPTEVVPLLVLAGRRNARGALGRVVLTGELDLNVDLVRRGLRLQPAVIDRVVEILDRGCPPMTAPTPSPRPRPARSPTRAPVPAAADARPALIDLEGLRVGLVEAAAREPVEVWMTWLHPDQAQQVRRRRAGPARIRGAAGTGKTVLALHRAKYLAARGDSVLVTSYLSTLLPVYRSLFRRLAPEQAHRVEFSSVHAVARRIVTRHGPQPAVRTTVLDTCFSRAWSAVRHDSPLASVALPQYWHEEISHVIKGRGITTFEQYAQLARVGRRIPLAMAHREAVWRLYQEYERLRTAAGVPDWADVLRQARDLVHAGTEAGRYDAVIVDEVQDLSCVGLQLLHGLLGRDADGLLLVGDGQQSIYPGGFTLAEAGISVVGRSTVLDRNYRNTDDVLRYALSVVGDDPFDDLEADLVAGLREVAVMRPGGQVVQAPPCRPEHQALVLATHIRTLRDAGVRLGDLAVLVRSNELAEKWRWSLQAEGLDATLLRDYDGTRSEAVKVGTFYRAKGLEFSHVLVPDRDRIPAPRRPAESEQAYQERVELERRQLFVALTRARDGLWLGATR